MTKDYLEKKKLISDFFIGYESEPLIINPESFFIVKKNGIFDAGIILELQKKVESFLGNGCFVVINDESINACAMEKDEVPIIALYAGTIKKVFCDACIMMLSDEFLTGVGNMAACYHDINIDERGLRVDEEDNSLLKIDISGDDIREAVGYMIANLAIHFIIYHEVGHHKLGHIKKLKEKYNHVLDMDIIEALEREGICVSKNCKRTDSYVAVKINKMWDIAGPFVSIREGNTELFKDFCELKIKEELLKYSQQSDYKNYCIRIHGFKNTAYSIGAKALGDLAYEMEKLSREGLPDELKELQRQLFEQYDRLTSVSR